MNFVNFLKNVYYNYNVFQSYQQKKEKLCGF